MTEVVDFWNETMDLDVPQDPRRKAIIDDEHLRIARIHYPPGDANEFHYHDGTSQALFVVKGALTVRTRHADGTVTEKVVREGQCALVADREHEQFANTTDEPALILQVLRPDVPVIRGRS